MDWVEKLRDLTKGRYGALREIHRRARISERTLANWLNDGRLPPDELTTTRHIAKSMGWSHRWFIDPEAGSTPIPATPDDAVRVAEFLLVGSGDFHSLLVVMNDPALLPRLVAYAEGLLSQSAGRPQRRAGRPKGRASS